MNKGAGIILKVLLAIGGVIVLLAALACGMFYMSIRAKKLPVETARDFIQLEPGDEVLHAYTGVRWLDSQRYFVVKADPAGFDARIAKLSVPTAPPSGGTTPDRAVRVVEGPGKELWYRSEAVPSWWDVDALESAVAVDVTSSRHNHSGSLSIFAKDRGLIYILDR